MTQTWAAKWKRFFLFPFQGLSWRNSTHVLFFFLFFSLPSFSLFFSLSHLSLQSPRNRSPFWFSKPFMVEDEHRQTWIFEDFMEFTVHYQFQICLKKGTLIIFKWPYLCNVIFTAVTTTNEDNSTKASMWSNTKL